MDFGDRERRTGVYEELVKWVLVTAHAVDDVPQAGEKAVEALEFSDEQAPCAAPFTGPAGP
jgi:hypothetical protein